MHSTTGGKPVWRFVNLHNNGQVSSWGVDRIREHFGTAAMHWDRFDICAAYWMFAMLWHEGQGSATYAKFSQLERLRFRPAMGWSQPRDLEPNAREIYRQLVVSRCGIHSTIGAA